MKNSKYLYQKGMQIELIEMHNDPRPIEPCTKGTIRNVDDIGTLHVEWENGRLLDLIPEEDEFKIITTEADSYENYWSK